MKIHDLIQGTPEWAAHRATHFNASDAPAMMGVSPYKSRAELLRETHTGVVPEVDAGTQKRFANGHRLEALARPLAEEIVAEEFYPITGSDGRLSASFDGLTMDERIVFEHKALGAGLTDAFRRMGEDPAPEAVIEHLPAHYRAQLEQQLMVAGSERALFMATNFDADGNLVEAKHCWYFPDAEMRSAILRGWAQFEKDLAAYVLTPRPEPAPVAPIETLPAVAVRMDGALVVQSNLPAFGLALREFVDRVPKRPSTDMEFAQTEAACKALKRAEEALDAAESNALASLADVNAMRTMVADFRELARTTRLASEKMVERRKLEVKEHAIDGARRALDEHIAHLNSEIAPLRMRPIVADFAGSIKGLKSVESIQDRLDTLLSTTKIAADADARSIRENVAVFKEHAAGFEFLFADLGQVVHKPGDDFKALVQGRIAQHKVAEAEREQKRMADAAARDAALAAAAAAAMAESNRARVAAEANAMAAAAVGVVAAPGQYPAPMQTPAEAAKRILAARLPEVPRADEPATLKLGDINARLAPLRLDAAGLSELGINPARTEGAAKLFCESDFERVLRAIAKHIEELQGVTA